MLHEGLQQQQQQLALLVLGFADVTTTHTHNAAENAYRGVRGGAHLGQLALLVL